MMKSKNLFVLIAVVIFSIFSSHYLSEDVVGDESLKVDNSGNTKKSYPPVETRKPNSDYKPAFPGQTRIEGVKTQTPYTVKLLAENLGRPWAIVPSPDGYFAVTEKTGHLLILDIDGRIIQKVKGFPKVDQDGQGGLLDIAFDPDFQKNEIVYWSFSEKIDGGSVLAVAKGKLDYSKDSIIDPKVIFRAMPPIKSGRHFGSRLVFDKEQNLFVSTGDRGTPQSRLQAQDLSSHLGKIIRIKKDGSPPPDNPFIGNEEYKPEIYAYGIRNSQGLDIHPETGELWQSEFGPMGGDEVNIIKSGKNYGWPDITYGIEYNGDKVGEGIQQKEGMKQPIYYWDPVLSPSGIVFYKGDEISEWRNNLFLGGLNSNHIARLVIEKNKVVGEERLLENLGERFRDIAYIKGMLYTITDSGRLYRIKKG